MTSYFRPDIKGDAVRKEMVLSRCTVTFFFFEQKVSFQTLTKVRYHLILKGGCLKTSEAPLLYPSPATPSFLSLPSSSSHLRHPQNTPFISSFLPSWIQQTFMRPLRSRGISCMKSSKTQLLSRKKT